MLFGVCMSTVTSFTLSSGYYIKRDAHISVLTLTTVFWSLNANGKNLEYINDLLIRNSDTHNRSTSFCNLNLKVALDVREVWKVVGCLL